MAPERRRGRGRGGKPPEDEAADHDLATDPQQSAPEPQATKPKRKKSGRSSIPVVQWAVLTASTHSHARAA